MTVTLRVLLIIASFLVLVFVLKKIRRTQLYIDDAIYWIVFSALLFLISVFPEIAIWAAKVLGIQSPANFVFLFVIFMVFIKLFDLAIELSVQKHRLNRLVQNLALMTEQEKEESEDGKN